MEDRTTMMSKSSSSSLPTSFLSSHYDERSLVSSSQGQAEQIPINEIPIRMWELDENSTHWDRMIAAPPDSDLVKFWSGWATIMLITGVVTTVILIPLLFTKKVRKNPFNLYLIFLMTPDMMVAWTCGFTCLSNALAGHFTTPFMCKFQSFYMIASIGANSWINLLVTRQLYLMLNAARLFQRHDLPSHRQVVKESLCVYVYALFLATLAMFDATWWPHHTRLTIGAACIPMDYDVKSTIFFYCIFFPLLFGIPLAYVIWAAYQIYKHKMLPPTGRRRILSIYFFRLAAVFVLMWLPGLLFLFVTAAWLDPWVQWAGGAWSHLQGLVSAAVSLLKPDIWKAVRDFWCCAHRKGMIDQFPPDGDAAGERKSTSIVTKKPWVNSSVYWSPAIEMGTSSKGSDGIARMKSLVSSYREDDDDLEAVGRQMVSTLDRQSNMLASDDSVNNFEEDGSDSDSNNNEDDCNVDMEDDRTPAAATETTAPQESCFMMEDLPPPLPPREPEAPVRTLYIVPKSGSKRDTTSTSISESNHDESTSHDQQKPEPAVQTLDQSQRTE